MSKTVISLTAIDQLMFDRFDVSRVLVVAPLRVARCVWPEEQARWDHLSLLRLSVLAGTEKQRIAALNASADVYIINRENVRWLVEYLDRSHTPWPFDMVVLDELSSFKNHQSQRLRALRRVRSRVSRVVGLTGTPAGNGLMDLWAEYRLIDLGERLGRFISHYRQKYFRPEKTNGQVVFSYAPLPGAEEQIYRRIADITISMRCTDHLSMPELVSVPYEVRMSAKEAEVYKRLKKEMVLSLQDGEVTAANAASLSGKLTQMANGAVYDDDGEVIELHKRKLDALEDLIEAQNGKPVLVAYWYKHDLKRIEARFREMGLSYRRIDTEESIRLWNAKRVTVGLIHPASAGHGLNLQGGGSTLIWFGLTWSLELYIQTNARLWRQGQASRSVVVEHIVCKGTIDERIMAALQQKEVTQSSLIDAVKAQLE